MWYHSLQLLSQTALGAGSFLKEQSQFYIAPAVKSLQPIFKDEQPGDMSDILNFWKDEIALQMQTYQSCAADFNCLIQALMSIDSTQGMLFFSN